MSVDELIVKLELLSEQYDKKYATAKQNYEDTNNDFYFGIMLAYGGVSDDIDNLLIEFWSKHEH